ncbi:MAG: fasciclin domain-containing protein [Ilumatobacteraceae bacterium]
MTDDNVPPDDPNVPDPDLPPTEPIIVPASDLPPTEPMYVEPVPPVADPTVVMPQAAVVPPVAMVPPPTDPNSAIPDDRRDPPWYENRGAVAAIIAVGLLGLFLLIGWLVFWSGDDDEQDLVVNSTTTALLIEGTTASTVDTTTTIPVATIVQGTTASTIEVTVPETTAPTTTAAPTTTVAPTTTTVATTVPPTTQPPATTVPVVSVPASPSATVFDIIAASPDLSRLNTLISDAGLQQELSGAGPITLFAPSNPAIDTLEASPGGAELLADPQRLRALLLGHVIPQALTADEIFAVNELTTASGETLPVDRAARTVDGAELLVLDVEGANGFIQVVDRVLLTN